MTEADRARQDEWMRDYYERFPYGEQDENGIDLSLIRANLRLTPKERVEKHNRGLALVLELKRAGEAHRARTDS